MRVCLVSVEIFAWGKFGGFGRATRLIGRELARRGVEVFAVVPRRTGQAPVEMLDGICVLGFPPHNPLASLRLFRSIGADVYHSQEPSLGTWLAQRACPAARHVVTFRDTRDREDWLTERALPSLSVAQVLANQWYEDNALVRSAVRRADRCYAAAHLLVAKAREKYGLARAPEFLPTPVCVPESPQKAVEPTVCFVSRLDRRKRPELFFDLARAFPQVRFLVAGQARDARYEAELLRDRDALPNLELCGFVDQFRGDELSRLLSRSWILVNTAAREGLPNAFIEAAAHGCAILSAVDPDGFASRFGRHVANDAFAPALAELLSEGRWRVLGEAARDYVSRHFALDLAIDRHLETYREVLAPARKRRIAPRASMAEAPRISVIVPTLGRRDLSALESAVREQSFPAAELVFVEDRERRGPSWARNRGIEQAEGELLAFLDEDCVPPAHWLASLVQALESTGAGGAGGTYEECDPFLADRRRRQRYPQAQTLDTGGLVGAGGNVLYRRELLERLRARDGHCFDERLRVAEDKELALRVRAAGERLVFVPVPVRHLKSIGAWSYIAQQFGRGAGIASLFARAGRPGAGARADRGLLFDAPDARSALGRWSTLAWRKALGPFDLSSFSRPSHFLLFWLGEKAQGLGFVWGSIAQGAPRQAGRAA